MNKLLKTALPVVVLIASILIAAALIATGPKPKRRMPPASHPTVEVLAANPTSYEVEVVTRGTVSPRTQSTLVPEISGRIIEIAPSFRNGGFFEQDDVLLTIDPRDYEIALIVARSELAQAKLRLREEEAQAEQARKDWEKLGAGAEPSALALRKPQLASSRAGVAAAQARLRQAEIDLKRTHIRAPYAGRVLEKSVDVGQYVAQGTALATVYAVDYVEIRLPLTDQQQAFLDLPETYRGEAQARSRGPEVTLAAEIGRKPHTWVGYIVRTEGAIDIPSRQLFAIAQVDDPYGRHDNRPPLKVGQFVQARVKGNRLDNVYVLPRGALKGENEVFVVNATKRLERRQLVIVWRDADSVVAADGLAPGERIALTSLPFAADGVLVRIKGEVLDAEQSRTESAEKG